MEIKIRHKDRQLNFEQAQTAGKNLLRRAIGADKTEVLISQAGKLFRESIFTAFVDCLNVSIDPERGEISAWSRFFRVDKSTISKLIKEIQAWQRGSGKRRPNPRLLTWISILVGTRGVPPMAKQATVQAIHETSLFVANYIGRPSEIRVSEIIAFNEFTLTEFNSTQSVLNGTLSLERSTVEAINQTNSELHILGSGPFTIQSLESLLYAKFESWLLTIAGIPNGRWFE